LLRVDSLQVRGLPPLSFSVPTGECLAIQGASGAGKSLLLRAIADLDPVDGRVFAAASERCEMTPQAWRTTVRYVAGDAAWWAATPRAHLPADTSRLPRLLGGLGLTTAHLDRPIAALSSGERQRLALLRALLDDPPILLLDEPTSMLDPANTALVEALLKFLLVQGRTILLVSHDAAQIDRLAHARLLLGKTPTADPRDGIARAVPEDRP
jgi:ABC-type iron transport system FetAB ATPase subunit